MIKIYDKIPKEYERVAIEEYFKFFNELFGMRYLFRYPNFKFTSDKNKLSHRELKDEFLMDAIEIVATQNDNIKFALSTLDNEHSVAIARVVERQKTVHIPEIVYLAYPTDVEKAKILSELLPEIEDYTKKLGFERVSYEVPKYDNVTLSFMLDDGWNPISESPRETESYKTYMLEKRVLKRDFDEPTLSRK